MIKNNVIMSKLSHRLRLRKFNDAILMYDKLIYLNPNQSEA